MSVKPIRDFVVVTKEEAPKTTSSGIFLAPTEEKNVTGTVTAVGSGRITVNGTIVPLEVKEGDKVVFNKHHASEIKHDDKVFFVLKEDQLICILS